MKEKKKYGFNTNAIHSGYPWGDKQCGAVPIFQTTPYHFKDTKNAANIFSGKEEGYVYSRINNPTVDVLEKKIAILEGAEAGLCTATGMAAINMVVTHLANHGDEFISGNRIYGGTFHLFEDRLKKKNNMKVRWANDVNDLSSWEKLITDKTKFIYAETPGNPTNEIIDIRALSQIAHKHEVPLIIDNTICTPALQNPIMLGADIVIHSMTKYICGHGTTLGGIVLGDKTLIDGIRAEGFRDTGPSLQAIDSWLIMQGLFTLSLRMNKHSENAVLVANFLENHPKVERVHYVGLLSNSQHELSKEQMRGASSLFSFELKGDACSGSRFTESLNLIGHMAHLGDVKTMVIQPAATTHEQLGEKARVKASIPDTMIRISVGLEDVIDITDDLDNALSKV